MTPPQVVFASLSKPTVSFHLAAPTLSYEDVTLCCYNESIPFPNFSIATLHKFAFFFRSYYKLQQKRVFHSCTFNVKKLFRFEPKTCAHSGSNGDKLACCPLYLILVCNNSKSFGTGTCDRVAFES